MLHELFIVLLLAVDFTSPIKKSTRLSKKAPHLPATCARVKCPREERPACARLVYRRAAGAGATAGNKTVYVVMLNECEINYVKCHEGLEAAIVPMKYCGHENILKTRHKRAKRDLASAVWHQAFRQGRRQIIKGPKRQGDDVDEEQAPEADEETPEGNEETSEGNEETPEGNEETPEGNEETPEGNEEASEANEGAPEGDQEAFPAGAPPSDTSIQEGIEDVDYEAHVVEQLNAAVSPEEQDFGVVYDQEFPDASVQDVESQKGGNGKRKHKVDWPYSESSASAELVFSFHAKGKKKEAQMIGDDEPNMDEYQADCPKVCPARDVMVCARCQHAVYRTFLSVCHMRMFQCEHKDEKLHLATRLPCMMSAPYLAESRMQPRGRVREVGDDDLVLRFLRCSALADKSREDDPRCYLEKQRLMLKLETYNISDMY